MLTPKQTKIITDYFRKQPEVAFVLIFGSKARNEDNERSDIDLAVYFPNNKINHFLLQGKYLAQLSVLLDTQVDVANLNASDVAFCYRVLSEGKMLYQKDPFSLKTFQLNLVKNYFDLKPAYDLYYEELSQRIRSDKFATNIP